MFLVRHVVLLESFTVYVNKSLFILYKHLYFYLSGFHKFHPATLYSNHYIQRHYVFYMLILKSEKMNGLTLRISKSLKNSRNYVKFSIVSLTISNNDTDMVKAMKEQFNVCPNIEEQLKLIKELLFNSRNLFDTAEFLVHVFLKSDPKHPLKLFLARHITENTPIQPSFTSLLIKNVNILTTNTYPVFLDYSDVVNKVASIIENFPVGVSAMKTLDVQLIWYLKDCLEICMEKLRSNTVLSPTEKNDIFNLAHLTFRLLLNFIQKLEDHKVPDLNSVFSDIKLAIEYFIADSDVPMDTKAVCGIVYLTIYILENGRKSWIDIVTPNKGRLSNMLVNDGAQLCMYAAIFTIVPMNELQNESLSEGPAVVVLTERILAVGERSSSESTFVLFVARSVLQISKLLDQIRDSNVGLHIIDHLLLFIWGHLEHHMDSVRHLTPQALGFISKYCSRLKQEGNPKAIQKLLSSLSSLDKCRKVYYVIIKLLISELGSEELLVLIPGLVEEVLDATGNQAVQATATTALETLIQKHAQENGSTINFELILSPILKRITKRNLTSIELDLLEGLLMTAFKIDQNFENLKPYLEWSSREFDVKCGLVLLGVIRKCIAGDSWRQYLTDDVINMAATHTDPETRILSLSFMVTSPKSTEVFEQEDLDFILYFLKYNINEQSPNFRQLLLSLFKKFIKRFEDGYKTLRRQNNLKQISNKDHYYLLFLEELRSLCFHSLLPGANYSRRVVALQILVWTGDIDVGQNSRNWNADYVEKLLYHLDDSYENNKANALQVLEHCPTELLKGTTNSISLDLESIIVEANSNKPTDCVSAAYKLALLIRKLPEKITSKVNYSLTYEGPQSASYAAISVLLQELRSSVGRCQRSLAEASFHSPMYGLLRCMRRCIYELDVLATVSLSWKQLIQAVVEASRSASEAAGTLLCSRSPEGALPTEHHSYTGNVILDDGTVVTAQMILLCAWRTVKEVSLLLGEITSKFTIDGEHGEGILSKELLASIEDHFTTLLTDTKHRGAFEQAYVGYTMYLNRMWRSGDGGVWSSLCGRVWSMLRHIQSDTELSATRRSAGIPFIIQALLTTEYSASGSSKLFSSVMTSLLQLAAEHRSVETRTHAINILRALYRCTHLQSAAHESVSGGLLLCMRGFRSNSWMERNASTLLFSSLLSRVFGVARARSDVSIRNKMTGRIFFLRYPLLYDYMLSKLEEASDIGESELLPALYPVLLLLSRLYPSSLEGTVSNLKLSRFIPAVCSCSKSAVEGTRRLCARALLPLLHHHVYFEHVESILKLICDRNIKRNYCHGILLQLTTLLDGKPQDLSVDDALCMKLSFILIDTIWILEQTVSKTPCYPIADEYIRMINLMLWKYPKMINKKMLENIQTCLQNVLFENRTQIGITTSGMEVCLANATYLQIIITLLNKDDLYQLLLKGLQHDLYDVKLTVMNYLLLQSQEIELECCLFLKHLNNYSQCRNILNKIEPELFINIYKNTKHLETQMKCLKLLTIQKNNQEHIVAAKLNKEIQRNDFEIIVNTLIECIEQENEILTHIYLKNLIGLTDRDIDIRIHLVVLRVALECCVSENSEETRNVVVDFLEEKLIVLYELWLNCEDGIKFELKATLLATIIILLEDDETSIRDRVSTLTLKYISLALDNKSHSTLSGLKCSHEVTSNISEMVSSKAGEELRKMVAMGDLDESVATLVLIALLDFKSEVRLNDEITDECRVFDQSERYNIHLEETIWTSACADLIQAKCGNNAITFVKNIIHNVNYRNVIQKLCNDNFILFENMLFRGKNNNSDVINPKIKLFVNKIKNEK